jgi:hypothetical protein
MRNKPHTAPQFDNAADDDEPLDTHELKTPGAVETKTPPAVRELEKPAADELVSPVDRDNDGIPYCRKHHCRMKRASGGKKNSPTKYYSCPVPHCEERGQVVRTPHERVVPPAPLACPRCSRRGEEVFCERDLKATAMAVVLRCPACGWKSNAMASPQLAAMHAAQVQRRTKPEEEIGSR